jgi:hypothetical protein
MEKVSAKIYCRKYDFGIIVSNSLTIFLNGSSYTSENSISDELELHNYKNKSHNEFNISTSW